jgi:hypothetical protein
VLVGNLFPAKFDRMRSGSAKSPEQFQYQRSESQIRRKTNLFRERQLMTGVVGMKSFAEEEHTQCNFAYCASA